MIAVQLVEEGPAHLFAVDEPVLNEVVEDIGARTPVLERPARRASSRPLRGLRGSLGEHHEHAGIDAWRYGREGF